MMSPDQNDDPADNEIFWEEIELNKEIYLV
jgi:hypothetical protein